MTAIRAPDPGKSVHRIAAVEIAGHHPLCDRPQSSLLMLELYQVRESSFGIKSQNAANTLVIYVHVAGIVGYELGRAKQERIFTLFCIEHHHLLISEQFAGVPGPSGGNGSRYATILLNYLERVRRYTRTGCGCGENNHGYVSQRTSQDVYPIRMIPVCLPKGS